MGSYEKLLFKILSATSDANISFVDICKLLRKFGFEERLRGDHHIFTKDNVEEILNLQSKGSKSKSYQIKQVRNIIVRYKLSLEENNDK